MRARSTETLMASALASRRTAKSPSRAVSHPKARVRRWCRSRSRSRRRMVPSTYQLPIVVAACALRRRRRKNAVMFRAARVRAIDWANHLAFRSGSTDRGAAGSRPACWAFRWASAPTAAVTPATRRAYTRCAGVARGRAHRGSAPVDRALHARPFPEKRRVRRSPWAPSASRTSDTRTETPPWMQIDPHSEGSTTAATCRSCIATSTIVRDGGL